jgi:hypothetical protein
MICAYGPNPTVIQSHVINKDEYEQDNKQGYQNNEQGYHICLIWSTAFERIEFSMNLAQTGTQLGLIRG